jgi:3',5'-cyclic AMP phosphodiesterase CpdA
MSTTIAHLSDLHFGREDPRVVEAVLADLAERAPSLVAVSGDLTQRARRAEFERARVFLARIAAPTLVVPGNHDVPLFDVGRRFLAPLDRFRAYVTPDLAPVWEDDEVLAAGLNTARSLTWKAGRVSRAQMEALRVIFCRGDPARLHVLVAHHPFSPPAGRPREAVVGRAASALAALSGCGLDLVLTGHLHREFAGDLAGHTVARAALALHAGSAVSRRLREEANSYNLVRVRGPRVDVELRAFDGEAFAPVRTSRFLRTGEGWVAIGEPPALEPPGVSP